MSNLIKKVVAGFSTFALAASMLVMPVANTAHAAMAGEVYKTTDGTVWFITSNMTKRPFTSAGAFLSYGFLSFSQVKDADASVTALSTGDFIAPQDGRIFCATETKATDVKGECSLITGGKKAAFTSSTVFTGQGYSFARAYYGDSSFLEKTSNVDNASAQHRPGTLINNNGTIQMVVSGGLWGTPSMDVFNSWGWNIADVVPANSADVLLSQTGVIPARQAGQLVPTATTGGGSSDADCDDLSGDTGSISTNALADYNNEHIGEGEEEAPIMSFEVEAGDDSDVSVTSLKVEFDENEGGSEDLEDYISEVQIWYGDDMVGSADVDDFTETSTDGTWTKTVSLDCAAIAGDETGEFTVSVTANDVIDSGDLNQDWLVDVTSIRFEDGDGVVTTENSDADAGDFPNLAKTFDFQSFAAATDVELNTMLTEGEDGDAINDAHIVDIDDTDDTDDVEILAFTLENKGDSDITVNDIPVVITTTGEADEAVLLLGTTLWMDGDQISSDTVPTGGAVAFEDLDIELGPDESVDLVMAVDIQDTNGAADNGDTVQATVTVASIDAEDEEGDDLAGGDLTGTATGNTHAVYDAGIMVDFVSASATRTAIADAATESDTGEFKVVFDVTAFDGDMRIDKSWESDNGANAAGQGVVTDENISAADTTGWTITGSVSSSSTDAEDTADTFEVDEDTTRRFTVTVAITPDEDSFVEMVLESINWGTATNNTNANYYNFDMGDYKTDNIFLNDM